MFIHQRPDFERFVGETERFSSSEEQLLHKNERPVLSKVG
jgi:hypothetical protein